MEKPLPLANWVDSAPSWIVAIVTIIVAFVQVVRWAVNDRRKLDNMLGDLRRTVVRLEKELADANISATRRVASAQETVTHIGEKVAEAQAVTASPRRTTPNDEAGMGE